MLTYFAFQKGVANIIHAILYGFRQEYDDENYIRYLENTKEAFKILGMAGAIMIFPFLK